MVAARTTITVLLVVLVCLPVAAINPGTDIIVAAGGAAAGVPPSYWLSDLVVFNPGNLVATITVYYLPRGGGAENVDPLTFTVAGGATLIRPNVVGIDFGEQSFGALRVVSDQPVVVSSVVKNNPEGAGASDENAFGQGFPGIPVERAVVAGGTTHIAGLAQGDAQRSNFGVVDVSGGGSEVEVRLLDPSGAELASEQYQLQAWEPRQFNITDLGSGTFAAGTLEVEVTEGAVVSYASKVNNGSGDASTLEMYWSCGGSRTSSDGKYFFVSYTAGGSRSGGGSITVVGGQVVELCGNMIPLGKDPACALWLPYCSEGSLALADFVDGEDMDVSYSSGGAEIGAITWTMAFTITDNPAVTGTLTGTGSGWSGSSAGCDGAFPEMTVSGGVQ